MSLFLKIQRYDILDGLILVSRDIFMTSFFVVWSVQVLGAVE